MKFSRLPLRGFLLGSTGALIVMVAVSGASLGQSTAPVKLSALTAQVGTSPVADSPADTSASDTSDGGGGGDWGGPDDGSTGFAPGCGGSNATLFAAGNIQVPPDSSLVQEWARIFAQNTGRIFEEIRQISRSSGDCRSTVQTKVAQVVDISKEYECALRLKTAVGATAGQSTSRASGNLTGEESSFVDPFTLWKATLREIQQIHEAMGVSGITREKARDLQATYCDPLLTLPDDVIELFRAIRDSTAAISTQQRAENQNQLNRFNSLQEKLSEISGKL